MPRLRRNVRSPLCSRPVVQPRRIDLDGLWSNPKTGRRAFRQLAIRVDAPAPPCPDLDLGAFECPDIAPLTVPAQAKRRVEGEQLPPVIDFEAVQMQQTVIKIG